MEIDFFKRLGKRVQATESLLCVGLDPETDSAGKIVSLNKRIIEETAEYAACFKPNIAFYEAFGVEGYQALEGTLALIPEGVPILLDAKRSDIGNTARMYAKAFFEHLKVDAVTVNPYLGKEAVQPFTDYADKGVFLLARTSNPGADAIQGLWVLDPGQRGPMPLYLKVAMEVTCWAKNIGLVVAGNNPQVLREIRDMVPETWFLAPGIGAQGGEVAEAIKAGARKDGSGILLNVSRSIAGAASPREEARKLRDSMRKARESFKVFVPEPGKRKAQDIIRGMIGEECFKVGSFVLKSGKSSPFYIDMRRLISNPVLQDSVADLYVEMLSKLEFDRIAGIPLAAIPLSTLASLKMKKPMVFPRIEKKGHGTGNAIEGAFASGERVVLVDDLITTGKSKYEAIEILRDAGLVVTDLVVLLERGMGVREELAEFGITLHSYFHVKDFVEVVLEMGIIQETQKSEIMRFLEQG